MATSMPFPPARLDEKTVADLSEKAKSWVPHLLELAATDKGFKSLGTKNNVKIFVSATEGQRVHLTKGVTTVRATSETIKRCFIAPDNESFNHLFTVIDPMFRVGGVVDVFPHGYQYPALPLFGIKWARFTLPGGILWDRDFVFLEHGDQVRQPDGTMLGYGVGHSIELPQCPPTEGLVRAEIFVSGYVFREIAPETVELTYILQADPKGWVPAWAVNMGATQQALNVGRIRDWLEGIQRAKQRMASDLEKFLSVSIDHAYLHDRTVPRRGTIRHTVRTKPGDNVQWIFTVEANDIDFSVAGIEGVDPTRMQRVTHEHSLTGKGVATGEEVTLHWSNAYSWLKEKRVYYSIRLPSGFAIGGGATSNEQTTDHAAAAAEPN